MFKQFSLRPARMRVAAGDEGRRVRFGTRLVAIGGGSGKAAPRGWPSAWAFVLSFLTGAATMFLLDPRMGRRRRALIRDKGVAGYHFLTRRLPSATRKRGVWVRDRLRGMTYELRHVVTRDGHLAPADDVELAQRVRSEVFRDPAIPDGAINVDAHEGVVTLRGELPSSDMIERVVEATERVRGVRKVRSLLHPPATTTTGPAEAGAEQTSGGEPRGS